jgi:hypothetical protein
VFKSTYARPSNVSINREGTLYKINGMMKPDFINGFFVENLNGICIYDISADGIKYIDNGGFNLSVGPYEVNINSFDANNTEIVQFGDSENPIYAARIDGVDMYISGDDVYAKRESDLNFEIVSMPSNRDGYGLYSVDVAGKTFKTKYDNPAGSVHRNKNFMYESNFIVSKNAVVGDIIGKVFPIGFFRPERIITNACESSKYPFSDGHVNSQNEFHPGEVAVVYSESDGEMLIRNNKYTTSDVLTYSFTSVLGRRFFDPSIVTSFGYVARDTMMSLATEHFLSKKILNSFSEFYKKKYSGSIERETAPYRVMWTKFKNTRTNEETIIIEHEYGLLHFGKSFGIHGCFKQLFQL